MKAGIMLMSGRGPDGKPWNWIEHLARCKEHGVEMVDLFDTMLRSVKMGVVEAKKILDDIGLRPGIYGVGTELMSPDPEVRLKSLNTIRRGMEICHELGIVYLLNLGGQHQNKGEESLKRYINGLSEAAEIAKGEGITLTIENAGTLCHTDAELLRCVNSVGKPNFKITLDPGNLILAGCDPHRAAEMLGPRVVHVHVKSFVEVIEGSKRSFPDKPFRYCPIGQGLVDYKRIRNILTSAGFDGCMSFEPEGGEDSRWYESIDTLVRIVKETR